MKTIIAPTNFSPASLNAVNYAADMALVLHADLVLLHIIQMPVSYDVPTTEYEYGAELQNVEQQLAELKKIMLLRTENEITITTKALVGSMLDEGEEVAEFKKPSIVVIGTERKIWAERFFLGSNSFTVVKDAKFPVLVVPPNAVFRHIKRIGLAVDYKSVYDMPLDILRELVDAFASAVDIIHVSASGEEETKGAVALSILKERLKEFDPETHLIIGNNIEDAVNSYAAWHHEDLLIVTARQHNFFELLLHKSRSRQIALHPTVPVLAVEV